MSDFTRCQANLSCCQNLGQKEKLQRLLGLLQLDLNRVRPFWPQIYVPGTSKLTYGTAAK